ncbi:unknown [[Mannheimia] succiniciproducens MBEL55E]|uniref:Uncharacterized protein n=1 Tax=Mannheimia succiniciproducens (strain KCTC 0769BP / MBEL55E) TaxID=221988 RepID=Q65U76_MANSM|nr:unknown [[Mannheimia] succiniciproducens MBEL55E]
MKDERNFYEKNNYCDFACHSNRTFNQCLGG